MLDIIIFLVRVFIALTLIKWIAKKLFRAFLMLQYAIIVRSERKLNPDPKTA